MSTGVIWLNKEQPNPLLPEPNRLWAVSDSLYSYNNKPSLDIGSKLFQIIINLYQKNPMTVEQPYLSLKIGYCFAGSTQAGLNTYALLCSILCTLRVFDNNYPSLEEIADACHRISVKHKTPIINDHIFEYSIFGFCLVHMRYECYRIRYEKTGDSMFKTIDLENEYLVIGSHCDEIKARIEKFKMDNDINILKYSRAPAYVVDEIIKNKVYIDIGGSLQLGITHGIQFDLYAVVHRDEEDNNVVYYKFNNIDVFRDVVSVGPCMIEPHALYLD